MTTDKQREEIFIKIHRIATVENINFASIQWKLFDEAWQAAQAAMQPEILELRKEVIDITDDHMKMAIVLSERDAKIAQLEENAWNEWAERALYS